MQPPEAPMVTPRDGSLFMRPFAIAATVYLTGLDVLFLITNGQIRAPDPLGDFYMLVLGIYASAPEVKQWMTEAPSPDAGRWDENIRKGGPIITLWVVLLMAACAWRVYRPDWAMPPDLKSTTMQVMTVFFGAYALRQARRGSQRRKILSGIPADEGAPDSKTPKADDHGRILTFLEDFGPATPKTLSEKLQIPRRSLARDLSDLVEDGRILRDASSGNDRSAVYRIK